MSVGSTGEAGPEQGRLAFDEVEPASGEPEVDVAPYETAGPDEGPKRVVRVLPDVAAVSKAFDYLVPEAWSRDGRGERLGIGSRVRIILHGRRVAGWVVDDQVEPPPGVALRPLSRLSGLGPSVELIELARWAAHRWVGPVAGLLSTASPPTMVEALGSPPHPWTVPTTGDRWYD
ncbi:MAG: hypothetical protein GY900_09875, partial [Actinomycetia bacterium]|nr:hypothetical protein [Actinomycetes bacterium]